jgi:hypothetical protein
MATSLPSPRLPQNDAFVTYFSASNVKSFVTGAIVGTLGGLIGLGGAEFRLPILIGLFSFKPLPAVILNKRQCT